MPQFVQGNICLILTTNREGIAQYQRRRPRASVPSLFSALSSEIRAFRRKLGRAMARPLRVEHEGAYWHVTQRGNEQQPIYRDDDDRRKFLELLAATVKRCRWRLQSYVLMTNHYHLLPQTPECTLSKGMHWLNFMYAQYFNRKYKRRGHLFQGRFEGQLIEDGPYLNEVLRYVVLNPVRARMVSHPADHQWSSNRALAGLERAPEWLATEWLLALDKEAGRRVRSIASLSKRSSRTGARPGTASSDRSTSA